MKRYATIFILLLITEIAIAYFKFHQFVRGFIGDVLIIPLLYSFVRMISKISGKSALFLVLSAAAIIEFLQLFSITERLQIENPILQVLLGNTFDGWDLGAYLIGGLLVLFIEKLRANGTN